MELDDTRGWQAGMSPSALNETNILYDERLSGRFKRFMMRLWFIGNICLFIWLEYYVFTAQTGNKSGLYYLSMYLFMIFIAIAIIFFLLQLFIIGPVQILSDGIVLPERDIIDLLMKRPTIILFKDIQQIEISTRYPTKIKIKINETRNIFISRQDVSDLQLFLKAIPEQYKSKLKLQDIS
jgi:hypothetical protein